LNGEAQEYRATVKLDGLVLRPDFIELDKDVTLRKPTREDFGKEVPLTPPPPPHESPLEKYTAILHAKVCAEEVIALHKEIDRELVVLRLFRSGAVRIVKYTIDTASIFRRAGVEGTIIGTELLRPEDKLLITQENIKPLKKFWSSMKGVMLPGFGYLDLQKKPDEVSIAYERYVDYFKEGVPEKRIASAVMGLEALYLSPSEQQEMSYRLRMRVGKLLGLVGYNSDEVRNSINDAYGIRSTYVHGGTLKPKERQRLERKHGDINKFPERIMDYLRASIAALLKKPSKTALIQEIDNSFLDSKKEEKIKKLLFMPY